MGEEIKITFETLYDLLMREKQREELSKLDESFFRDVIDYLKQKLAVLEKIGKDNDLFAIGEKDKIEAELKSIRKVLRDLYERREKKIIDMALNKSRTGSTMIDTDAMLEEEREFFEDAAEIMDRYRKGVLMNLFKADMPSMEQRKMVVNNDEKEEKQKETMAVRFINAVPKFVGSDMKVYGPFGQEDVSNLPKDVGQLLIEKGRVEEIKE